MEYELSPELVEQEAITENRSERIVSSKSDIYIAENADVTVTETIKVYANVNDIRRGIFRALPMVRNTKEGKLRINYKVLSVTRDGSTEPYHEKKEGNIQLKKT